MYCLHWSWQEASWFPLAWGTYHVALCMYPCQGLEGVPVMPAMPGLSKSKLDEPREGCTVPFWQLCELCTGLLGGNIWSQCRCNRAWAGHRQQASSNVCHVFFACSQAVSWITWRRFWMTYRTASYRSFSQIAAQARQQARSTSKPSSMTSCSSPVTAAPERLWPPRNQQWGFHRAVSPACARVGKACEVPKRGLWCLFLPCQGRRGTKAVSQPFLSLVWWPSATCGRLILKHVWRLHLIHTVRCKLVPFWGDIRKDFKINVSVRTEFPFHSCGMLLLQCSWHHEHLHFVLT